MGLNESGSLSLPLSDLVRPFCDCVVYLLPKPLNTRLSVDLAPRWSQLPQHAANTARHNKDTTSRRMRGRSKEAHKVAGDHLLPSYSIKMLRQKKKKKTDGLPAFLSGGNSKTFDPQPAIFVLNFFHSMVLSTSSILFCLP